MTGMQTASPPAPPSARAWHSRVTLPPHPGAADAFDAAIEALIHDFGAEEIWVYGSCAHGHPTRHSDVDFLVIRPTRPDCPRPGMAARLCLSSLPHFLPHDVLVLTPAQWAEHRRHPFGLYKEVLNLGIRIYAR